MKVVVINGPIGVGKTTLGKYIAEKNTGTAFFLNVGKMIKIVNGEQMNGSK